MNRKHVEHMKKKKDSYEESFRNMDMPDISEEFQTAISRYSGTEITRESALHREILFAV